MASALVHKLSNVDFKLSCRSLVKKSSFSRLPRPRFFRVAKTSAASFRNTYFVEGRADKGRSAYTSVMRLVVSSARTKSKNLTPRGSNLSRMKFKNSTAWSVKDGFRFLPFADGGFLPCTTLSGSPSLVFTPFTQRSFNCNRPWIAALKGAGGDAPH